MLPAMETPPTPRFRTLHEIGSQGVSLDVATNGQEMLIVLGGERLEAALVHVSAARAVPVRVPSLSVGQRQPTGESRQFAVFPRPDHQVPMIGHHAVSQQPHFRAIDRFFQNTLERVIILRLLKYRHSGIRPIQNMINQTTIGYSSWPSHLQNLPERFLPVKKRFLTPFSLHPRRWRGPNLGPSRGLRRPAIHPAWRLSLRLRCPFGVGRRDARTKITYRFDSRRVGILGRPCVRQLFPARSWIRKNSVGLTG